MGKFLIKDFLLCHRLFIPITRPRMRLVKGEPFDISALLACHKSLKDPKSDLSINGVAF